MGSFSTQCIAQRMAQDNISQCTATPHSIKSAHREFSKNDEHKYEYMSHLSRLDINRQIKAVSKSDLQKVIDRFPLDVELTAQCAHWVHALAGKHFFPDANHRTSIATLRQVTQDNDMAHLIMWSQEDHKSAVKESKEIRKEIDVNMGTLYKKDVLYSHWRSYFENII